MPAFKDSGKGPAIETPRRKRVSLKFQEDGGVDLSSIPGDVLEKLANQLHPVEAETVTAEDLLPEITEENVRAGLGMIARVNSMLFPWVSKIALKFQIDPDISAQSFRWNEQQLAEMAPRGVRLAQKYTPEFVKKHQDVIFLAGMMAHYSAQNFERAIVTQQVRNMQKAQKQPAQATQPENGEAARAQVIG